VCPGGYRGQTAHPRVMRPREVSLGVSRSNIEFSASGSGSPKDDQGPSVAPLRRRPRLRCPSGTTSELGRGPLASPSVPGCPGSPGSLPSSISSLFSPPKRSADFLD
jgi:hypothetical protein